MLMMVKHQMNCEMLTLELLNIRKAPDFHPHESSVKQHGHSNVVYIHTNTSCTYLASIPGRIFAFISDPANNKAW